MEYPDRSYCPALAAAVVLHCCAVAVAHPVVAGIHAVALAVVVLAGTVAAVLVAVVVLGCIVVAAVVAGNRYYFAMARYFDAQYKHNQALHRLALALFAGRFDRQTS